jgi:hypothetical protein
MCDFAEFAISPNLRFRRICDFAEFVISPNLLFRRICNFAEFAISPNLRFRRICNFAEFAISPNLRFRRNRRGLSARVAPDDGLVSSRVTRGPMLWFLNYFRPNIFVEKI